MNGWQEPKDGKRIYIITDNTKMDGFTDYIKSEDVERLYVTYSESRVNLGIHYYRNKLYTSNLVGICRIKSVDDETLYDAEGNELLIKVIPRFNVKIVELLNYMRDDDEFDRYMAPQTISNRHKERDIEAIDRNEIFPLTFPVRFFSFFIILPISGFLHNNLSNVRNTVTVIILFSPEIFSSTFKGFSFT